MTDGDIMNSYLKIFSLLLCLALVLVSAGCVGSDSGKDDQTGSGAGEDGQEPSRVLVVYFSRTGEQYNVGEITEGNTAAVAGMIADKTGADVFEIIPAENRYPRTYEELLEAAQKEKDENARPKYLGKGPDLSDYDTVFIGAPVWYGDWPMIMYTYFENNKDGLAGKTLIPFSTHEGSGLAGFDSKLAAACPESTVGKGLAVKGTDAQNDQENVKKTVDEWLSGLGF